MTCYYGINILFLDSWNIFLFVLVSAIWLWYFVSLTVYLGFFSFQGGYCFILFDIYPAFVLWGFLNAWLDISSQLKQNYFSEILILLHFFLSPIFWSVSQYANLMYSVTLIYCSLFGKFVLICLWVCQENQLVIANTFFQ